MGWVAHRLLVSCSVLGVAVKPVLLTYLLLTYYLCSTYFVDDDIMFAFHSAPDLTRAFDALKAARCDVALL